MKKIFAALIACCITQVLPAQDGMLSKEQFHQKIKQSFTNTGAVSSLDLNSRLYTDAVYRLPPPLYKASYTITTHSKDSCFFYYYALKDIDSVRNACWQYGFDDGNLYYKTSLPWRDSSNKFFIIYFFPASYDKAKTEKLNQDVVAAFKLPAGQVIEDEVIMEAVEIVEEPPPPPPPPAKPTSTSTKPVKKKNPA